MPQAHNWIINHWSEIESGDVVDVQYILNETTAPKTAEIGDAKCPPSDMPTILPSAGLIAGAENEKILTAVAGLTPLM